MTTATVRGIGRVELAPDRALARFVVRAFSEDRLDAAQRAAHASARIGDLLATLPGVADASATSRTWSHEMRIEEGGTMTRHYAETTWSAAFDDFDSLATAATLASSGADMSLDHVHWTLRDAAAALRQARVDAISDARATANDYATALGMKVHAVTHVADSGTGQAEPSDFVARGPSGSSGSFGEREAPAPDLVPPPTLSFRDTVEVSFRLVPAAASA